MLRWILFHHPHWWKILRRDFREVPIYRRCKLCGRQEFRVASMLEDGQYQLTDEWKADRSERRE